MRLRSMMIGVVFLALTLAVAFQVIQRRREEARTREHVKVAQLRAARAASFTTPVPGVITKQANASQPRHKVRVTCFNGKIDSGSLCSTGLSQPDGTLHQAGKMICGYPGKSSEIECAFIGRRGDSDVYRFTRRFPLGAPEMNTTKKEVEFSGERVRVFEDESQCIVIEGDKL